MAYYKLIKKENKWTFQLFPDKFYPNQYMSQSSEYETEKDALNGLQRFKHYMLFDYTERDTVNKQYNETSWRYVIYFSKDNSEFFMTRPLGKYEVKNGLKRIIKYYNSELKY